MELQRGAQLFWQQFNALMKKNKILTWRHKRSAFLQLFSSFFFILLIFCIDKAVRSRFSFFTAFDSVLDPKAVVSPPIPPCEEKFFIKEPCFDFVWSGNSSARIRGIAAAIMRNNPGRPIPSYKVKSFINPDEVDEWLLGNPLRCPGALHFVEKNSTIISYGLQTNSTSMLKRGNSEDPTFKFQIPLQVAAEREIARSLLGDPSFEWVVGFKEFAHPATETFSVVGEAGATFFLAVAMFGFVIQTSSFVTEKELKLRQAMSIMGLYESAYWLSWFTWEAFLTLIASLSTVLFGMLFQFSFFLRNSFAILILVFFLFQLNMLSFAFLISTFVDKSSSATTAGFSIFIIGFLTQLVTTFGFPYAENYSKLYRFIWSLFPPNLLAKALDILVSATATHEDPGIRWHRRGHCTYKEPNCVMTIENIFHWLISTFFLWFALAIYLDNILPDSNGVRKSVFYFLKPSYWTGKGGTRVEGDLCGCASSIPPIEYVAPDDEDVLVEETTIKQQVVDNSVDPNVAVTILGLAKTYPGATKLCCCKCKRSSPYHAVKGIWVNIAKDQLFCLLGPNGAGKTTVINCLIGITPVTDGDALIYGNSIRSSVGMSNIRRTIGVCPQFDTLWDALTAEEHLHLFASIKGLHPSIIKSVSEKSLAEVNLTSASHIRTGSYSGGMKRRLSFAIALIGDPQMVFLDEPTTGMDPVSRRHVWDIIENAKKGRAIVLTTHSMEEADILSDRIAIMAKGRLRCIGTSIRLKSRFGTGYIANISFLGSTPIDAEWEAAHERKAQLVKHFFKHHLDVEPKEENKSFLTFVIPRDKERLLTDFFAELQDREDEFGISDIQLGLTTLEEVFLNIAKQAELESASADGSMVLLNLSSGPSIQIPKGSRFVGIPGTDTTDNPRGLMVEIYWEQDDSGNLCISGHSPEISIPPNVKIPENYLTSSRNSRRGSSSKTGFVIDPNQILNR
ncbi:hypothetical protein KFK09_008194 [Dendrobium nobile]|uniref:ABC transporter domain-containing protein n=1 Tax=Dendrobium nobile TaxID=94219 RepID=A0A8T3BM28_DENNO|nr:hypothetical protein KFK09_008194 [Dendrobium nobile]